MLRTFPRCNTEIQLDLLFIIAIGNASKLVGDKGVCHAFLHSRGCQRVDEFGPGYRNHIRRSPPAVEISVANSWIETPAFTEFPTCLPRLRSSTGRQGTRVNSRLFSITAILVADLHSLLNVETRSDLGRDCRDAFLGLSKTCAKLGLAFWDYLGSRLAVPRPPRDPNAANPCSMPRETSLKHDCPSFCRYYNTH
jgi:hypothetical protein